MISFKFSKYHLAMFIICSTFAPKLGITETCKREIKTNNNVKKIIETNYITETVFKTIITEDNITETIVLTLTKKPNTTETETRKETIEIWVS